MRKDGEVIAKMMPFKIVTIKKCLKMSLNLFKH